MLNEKNPLTSQALSDDDLDGVVGGNVGNCENPDGTITFNGVTYQSQNEMPADVKKQYRLYLYRYTKSTYGKPFSRCSRCSASCRTEELVESPAFGMVCPDCQQRLGLV